MEIVYIWVREYKNLKNFGLNLSSKERFSYDHEKNSLSISKLDRLPKEFFPRNISDAIALIGKNGSGKSNALELICNAIKGSKDVILSDFFVITRTSGTKKYSGYYKFSSLNPPKSNSVVFEEHAGDIDPVSVVFFSNVYDKRRNNFSEKIIDLSENSKERMRFRWANKNYWDVDFLKQIEFAESENYSQLGIGDPIAFNISINVFNAASKTSNYGVPDEGLQALHSLIRRRTKDTQPTTRLVFLTQYIYIVGFLNAQFSTFNYSEVQESHFYDIDYEVQKIMSNNNLTDDILKGVIAVIRERCVEHKLLTSKSKEMFCHSTLTDGELLTAQFDFLSKLSSAVSNLKVEYSSDGIRDRSQQSFTIPHSPCSQSLLKQFSSLLSFIRFMTLDWTGLSSGQKAYLNLFSSLSAAIKKINDTEIILCIDEGDLYLHPKWQVDFLQYLLSVVSTAASTKVQLILTSHSPLLISDLPRQNIEILGPDEGLDEDFQTFGANLYDLYAGPLFLKGSTSGLFSTLKISAFMEILRDPKSNAEEATYVRSFLKIFGDKILKYKFEETYKP